MKKGYCDITFIIDRSGSMSRLRLDVIGSFNTFVDDQKKVEGVATLTRVQFDDRYQVDTDAVDIQTVAHLCTSTYVPRGNTAMYDAIGKTIVAAGERLAALPEEERPEKVIVLIQTDGQENASREYTAEAVKSLIQEQQDKYSWEFVFLGANIDAVGAAKGLGIDVANAMKYADNTEGMRAAFTSLSENMASYRMGGKVSMAYEDKDTKAQCAAGV